MVRLVRLVCLTLFLAARPFSVSAFADAPTKPAVDRPQADTVAAKALIAAKALVAAVNAVVDSDVGIPAAEVTRCSLDALPSSRATILPLLPPGHRRLIAECARGRTRVRRHVRGFELLALLDDPVDATADAAAIRAYFDARTVDVAVGSAISGEPYAIAFDWVVVLDAEARTVSSFIVNCRD